MSSDAPWMNRTDDEAAQWFSKLNETSVSATTLEAFYAWRREPLNDAAYRKIERVWDQSGRLAGDQDIHAALERARTRAKSARGRRSPQWRLGFISAAAVVCAGVFAYVEMRKSDGEVFSTGIGEQRTVALADGSRVKLDTNSRIAIHFNPQFRSVTLVQGQAIFDVAHLSNRPFQVRAGATVIRDLGTQFDVRKDSAGVQVTLLAGAVQIMEANQRAPERMTKPGQQIIVGRGGTRTQTVDASVVTSWTTGRLVFDDQTLETATAEINRYAEHKVTLAADDVAGIRVTGTFNTNDPEAFASAVAKLYDLSIHRQVDGGIRLQRDAEPSSEKKS